MADTPRMVAFADFSFDHATAELTRNGTRVALEHQPALVLARLLSARGAVVTREDLIELLWGASTHVKFDDGVNYCVRQVRAALADDPRAPRFVQTLPRRGYRFIAPVRDASAVSVPGRRWARIGAAAAMLLITAILESQPNRHHEIVVACLRMVHDAVF